MKTKIDIGKPQLTTIAGISLAIEHILTAFGDKTLGGFLSSIPNMSMLELSNTFFPLIVAVFLWVYNEDKEPDVKYIVKKK